MAQRVTDEKCALSRRSLLATTGGVLVGAAAQGLVGQASAGSRRPKRGGVLRFATRGDATGLDPHRNTYYLVSTPLAATSQGLLDLNLHAEPVPGIATEWDAAADLLTYTFKLRKGVLFHNGREVDAEAIKWNFDRIRDPKTSHPFMRSTLQNLKETVALDKYTLRCHLEQPSAAFPSDVVYYPCNLIAPDSVDKVDTHPIGCGPFKFVRWERDNITELVRFEHYFETDDNGDSLPYLDGILGQPKKEDRVRLTALRAGEVDLIDTMAYTDAAEFAKKYAGKFQTWEVPIVGTSYLFFNLNTGPFTDKRVRQAAAHAIDHEAVLQAVFSGQGVIARGFYAPASAWHTPDVAAWPEYDPDKARFLLRQANANGAEVLLQSLASYPYLRQTGELVQAMWTEVGFKVVHHVDESPVLQQRRRDRTFHAESTSGSFRFDPDGWFSRTLFSTAPTNKEQAGFRHERADRLMIEARQTANKQKRLELYTEIDSLVNQELPLLYMHHITMLEAGGLNLKGYQPAIAGAFSTQGAGIRTAWLA
jgi:peptide/nickel transport system substrate-binding protein